MVLADLLFTVISLAVSSVYVWLRYFVLK